MSKLHRDLATILRRHLGPAPKVSKSVLAAIHELNDVFWAQDAGGDPWPEPTDGIAEAELLQSTLDSSMDCIAVVDRNGRIIAYNRRFVDVWNIPDSVLETEDFRKVLPHILFELRHPELFERHVADLKEDSAATRHEVLEFLDGRYFELHTQPQGIASGEPARTWSFRDVSRIKQAEEAFRHDAFHDALTGLPNRALFLDRVGQAIAHAKRSEERVALMFLDLDRFKSVNDTLGHGAGDELLKAVASRLHARVRAQDTVSRLAGDEFMVLITELRSEEGASHVAESILDMLRVPFRIDDHELRVGASIGISLYPDDGDEVGVLMKHADVALYAAKEEGRNRYKLFQAGMSNANADKMLFENDLRSAVTDNELLVHYQPIISLATGEIVAVEALVRWQRGDGPIIPPARFIPIAESSGLIGPISEWVLDAAGRESRLWQPRRERPLLVSVNFSAQQFWDPRLVSRIEQQLVAAELDPSGLVLELTESTIMRDPARGLETLRSLRDMGVRVALDDFGTGHSSLSFLRHMPISTLKIDRSFISQCDVDERDGAIVAAIIQMAKSLELQVIAEGVEKKSQAEFLIDHGCDCAQGFWFSRPIPAQEMAKLLDAPAEPKVEARIGMAT